MSFKFQPYKLAIVCFNFLFQSLQRALGGFPLGKIDNQIYLQETTTILSNLEFCNILMELQRYDRAQHKSQRESQRELQKECSSQSLQREL